MNKRTVTRTAWVLLAALGGCNADPDPGPGGTYTFVHVRIAQVEAIQVDLVVMVDNSGSMAQEQAALTQRFPDLIGELVDPPDRNGDGMPDHPAVEDLNIGVVSSDMGSMGYRVTTCADSSVGDDGCFMHIPSPSVIGCAETYPRFLARSDSSYNPAQMAQDFACIAMLGTQGCGFEQQFKSVLKALKEDTQGGRCNEGFLRPSSLLGVIFVTDEEDCSVDPAHPEMLDPAAVPTLGHLNIRCFLHPEFVQSVSWYYNELLALRPGRPEKLVIGMIVGVPPDAPGCIGTGDELSDCLTYPGMVPTLDPSDPTALVPSCNTDMGYAFPPVRFVQLAQMLGDRAYVGSICQHDWSGPLRAITDQLVERLGSICFPQDLPLDPVACTVPCVIVETLSDLRSCEADPTCPQEWCPGVSDDELGSPPPCADPASGSACEPLKRDLGTMVNEAGVPVRQCLLRQATRVPDLASCGAPSEEGWYYEAPGPGPDGIDGTADDVPCPQLILTRGTGSLIELGSVADLHCVIERCPEERQCGGLANPDAVCCASGEVCVGGGSGAGICCPTTRAGDSICCEETQFWSEAAGRCVAVGEG